METKEEIKKLKKKKVKRRLELKHNAESECKWEKRK